jgi:hypothetical protein
LNAVVFNEPGAMELEEIETGDNGSGEVLAKVETATVFGDGAHMPRGKGKVRGDTVKGGRMEVCSLIAR